MNYGKIIYCDTSNGIGCRTVLFVSGCTHHCKGCFNDMAWPFNYGKEYTKETENKILERNIVITEVPYYETGNEANGITSYIA